MLHNLNIMLNNGDISYISSSDTGHSKGIARDLLCHAALEAVNIKTRKLYFCISNITQKMILQIIVGPIIDNNTGIISQLLRKLAQNS